jgi:arsenate reductase
VKPSRYQKLAARTASQDNHDLYHYVLGVCTEAGELAHQAKAHLAYGKDLDRANVIEELGDLSWYMANLMRLMGTSWEEVWEINIEKLRQRYPEGFEQERALSRDLVAERKILDRESRSPVPMTLYHNPRCSKSRQTLALLEEKGVKVEIIKYLETPPSPEVLKEILHKLDLRPEQLLRKKEALFKENFLGQELSDPEWIRVLCENPKLMERPIAVTETGAALGRPPEKVLELLD